MNNSPTAVATRHTQVNSPVIYQKTVDTRKGIELLNAFVSEVRKEFRRRNKLTVKGNFVKTDFNKISFINQDFSLTIDFNERITL